MQFSTKLDLPSLRDSVADRLRRMIVDGELPAGERLNEVHLAAALGVSRTPLREALGLLGAEGALESVPRIGWFVRPLTLEEFDQLYPMRALLDPEALRLAGLPAAERLERLAALNAEMMRPREAPEEVLAIDDAWHRELVAGCPNQVLVDLIEQFIRRTRRYEIALMRERRNVSVSVADHERIMDALRGGDLAGACAMLKRNMESGTEPLRDWLRAREATQRAGAGDTRRRRR